MKTAAEMRALSDSSGDEKVKREIDKILKDIEEVASDGSGYIKRTGVSYAAKVRLRDLGFKLEEVVSREYHCQIIYVDCPYTKISW